MIELRKYQKNIINSLRDSLRNGNKRLVLCAPTGSGKTIMFTYIAKRHIEKGGRVLVFTHRKELLNQAGGAFEKFGMEPELITAGSSPDLSKSLHVSMIETFDRRKEDYSIFISSRTLIIIDEAHLNSFTKIFDSFPSGIIVIGATATPYRKGKSIPELADFYQDLIQEVDTIELIDMGFLSNAKTYGVQIDLSKAKKKGEDYDVSEYYEENKMWHGVVKNWKRLTPNTKTLLFSSNVESSKKVCEEFVLQGFDARHIDGKTPKKEREAVLKWFDKTLDAIICNCGILNAGFDQPDIETVILYRATTSLPLFLQMCGRGSRITETKKTFSILDFGNNVNRLGFWENPRTWTLYNDKKKTNKEEEQPIKICPNCTAIIPKNIKECPHCEYEFIKTEDEEIDEKIAELVFMEAKVRVTDVLKEDNKVLSKMAKAKLINSFAVLHKKTDIKDAREFCKLMGYKMPGFEWANQNRFKVFNK